MSIVRRPPRPPQRAFARAWWLAGVADPAWLAVALTVVARALGVADPARALASALAITVDGRGEGGETPPEAHGGGWSSGSGGSGPVGQGSGSSAEEPAHDGAGADRGIDLTGGTGMTGTTTGGLVDGGATGGLTTTGTSAPGDAATTPSPAPGDVPSVGAQGGTGKGRSPVVGDGGLDEAAVADDVRTPALTTDEVGGD